MANIIADVARLLGVELGVEFNVKIIKTGKILKHCGENEIYKLTDNGLISFSSYSNEWRGANIFLCELLVGEYEIVKLPWQPKEGENYYYISFKEEEKPYVYWTSWKGTEIDYALLNAGVVHRTEEEAKAHRAEDYKKLTGREWSGENDVARSY